VHQWSKNLLVFVPVMLSHHFTNTRVLLGSLVGFIAFSLAASLVYIVNDLFDVQTDRLHPRKKNRPFASGEVSSACGLVLAFVLAAVLALICCLMPLAASLFIAAYLVCAFAYSFVIKRMLFADVVLLAGFYTLRILFGGAATGINISIWTLALSMFLFLTLALSKRITDLKTSLGQSTADVSGRAYKSPDLPQLASFASASGYLAVLVMALYINSPEVTILYRRPQFLWAICPLLIYWISRVLILANRGCMHDDPVVFAFRDKVSWFAAAGIVVFGVLAL
jgi:4-hydroxybenzoate polyprenyltransferase